MQDFHSTPKLQLNPHWLVTAALMNAFAVIHQAATGLSCWQENALNNWQPSFSLYHISQSCHSYLKRLLGVAWDFSSSIQDILRFTFSFKRNSDMLNKELTKIRNIIVPNGICFGNLHLKWHMFLYVLWKNHAWASTDLWTSRGHEDKLALMWTEPFCKIPPQQSLVGYKC